MWGLVVGVSVFILWNYGTLWWVLVLPNWEYYSQTVLGILQLMMMQCCVTMILWVYYKAVRTSPGSPPTGWVPENVDKEAVEEAMKHKTAPPPPDPDDNSFMTRLRYCVRCASFKPSRAHHCSMCRVCVLRKDHHCPWINNCVGEYNQKYFVLFLGYTIVGCTYALVLYVITVASIISSNKKLEPKERDIGGMIASVFNLIFVVPLILGLSGLLYWQITMIGKNVTPYEDVYERKPRIKAARKKGTTYKWPYDHGWSKNLRQVLGNSVWSWFWPTLPPKTEFEKGKHPQYQMIGMLTDAAEEV